MQKAFERGEEYTRDGKCLKREWSIGPIVPWAIVALVALLTRQALVSLPAPFWEFVKR